MEIVNSIAAKISGSVIDAIVDQLGYLVHYKRNIQDFEKQAEDLKLTIAVVEGSIVEAKNRGETIHQYVHDLLNMITEDKKHKNFPNVSCFNFFQRYRSSKEAKKMRDEFAEFDKKLDKIVDKVGYRGILPWMDSVLGYLSFQSRNLIINNIVNALQDPDINIIGVYGMGGTGKTMLVKQIACQVRDSKLFDHVIMAVVGQNPQVKNIQGQLADRLSFKFKEETEQGRADSLRNRLLKEDKKILIIIDDVWNGLDFETVGIPIPSANNSKGSKIIVTSRSHDIVYSEMSIEKNFNVEDLSKDDSWNLFKNKVGECIETNNQFKEIATKIANKCGKLPLALVLVGKALKGKSLAVWKDALRQLNNPAGEGIHGISKEAYTSIKLSYDHIESQEVKTLFLLCSMFPDDYNIDVDHLLIYARGLEFLNGVHTLEATRNRIVKLIDDLESSCLLQKCEPTWGGRLYVKMHDVIRDVAINIASKDNQMCTLGYGKGLNKVQDEKTDRHYTAIFANCVNFEDLPKELNFSKLKLLTLLDNDKSLQIPEDCFERMGNLEFLHLKGMSFSPSPSSFNHLAKLRTLLLIGCNLENIDMIGKLEKLEILDFSHSNITELPLRLSQLSGLKQLKVSKCRQLKVIQPEVISRMTKLKELFLDDTFNDWGVGESSNCEQKQEKARISELGHLSCLTCLYLCIPDVRSLRELVLLNNLELERFHIVIGTTKWNHYSESEKMLVIETDSINDHVLKELHLLEKSEDLRLEGTCGVRNVVLKLKTSVHLKYLRLKDNEEVEYLVSELDDPNHDAFSILETLVLENMKRLETIINEGYSFKTFEKLKTLEIWRCDKMKYLLSVAIVEGLSNLERIEIKHCKMMKAIVVVIENEAPVDNKMEFRRLRKLDLGFLPELKSFCGNLVKANGLIESQSSEIVEDDHQIQSSEIKVSLPSLDSLKIENVNNLEIIWHNRLVVDDMSNLRSVKLDKCKSLKCMFTSNVMSALKQLDELHIQNCDSLEQVFEIHPMIEPKEHREVASINLRELVLCNLPSLKHVWSNDPFEMYQFQDLNDVKVTECPKLITLFPPSMARDLPRQLQRLQVDDFVDIIFMKQEPSSAEGTICKDAFIGLKEMELW